jgi:hypothetical protein
MLTCPRCGTENPLGRVFCQKCGAKLDLAHTSSREIEQSLRDGARRRVGGAVLFGILVMLGVCVALALWPRDVLIGQRGTRMGRRRVVTQLMPVKALRPGQELALTLAEADINEYFEFHKTRELRLSAVSVRATPDRLALRLVKALGTLDVGSLRIGPKISFDVLLAGSEGRLRLRGASVGHLPFPGFSRLLAAGLVTRLVPRDQEVALLADVENVEIHDGRLVLLFKK